MPDEWIRQWGDPTLHEIAAPVVRADELLRRQVERMGRRLIRAEGAGLAATQVGVLRRVFVYRADRDGPVETLVNPRIVARSQETELFAEGCLSFLAVIVEVRRPSAVRVTGQDLDGHARTIDAEGFEASLLQHELDHLDGILTLDRAEPAERRRAIATLLAPRPAAEAAA